MNGETLVESTDYFQPFPRPEDVFASHVEEHVEYLLPLASVTLSHICPDWSGKAHFVLPIEPHDGVVGEHSQDNHNYLCRTNWLGYRITDDKYELASNFSYFLKPTLEAKPRKGKRQIAALENLNAHYTRLLELYGKQAKQFHKNQCIPCPGARRRAGRYRAEDRLALVRNLGGVSSYGNWAAIGSFPLSKKSYTDERGNEDIAAYPLTEDGREFAFIGSIPAWNYLPRYGCGLLLFYDPKNRIALTTFDWS